MRFYADVAAIPGQPQAEYTHAMDRDRDRDPKRDLPAHSASTTSLASPSMDTLLPSKKELLDESELGDAARQRLLQREAGAAELGVELRALRERGTQVDTLPVEARLKERDRAVVDILAKSFSEQAYAEISKDRTRRWDDLEPGEKLQVFRLAEARVAVFENVEPCSVLGFLSTEAVAQFDWEHNSILVHEDEVLKVADEKQAMFVLIHEQTHRTQYDAIRNPSRYPYLSAALIAEWRENWYNFRKPGTTPESRKEYENQPLEKYADTRSELIVGKHYGY